MEKHETKCRVKFVVSTPHPVRRLYICGNTDNLGAWEVKNAKEMHKNGSSFELTKMFNEGEEVSFKVLEKMNWERVEIGYWYEDVSNHTFTAQKGLVVTLTIPNFKYEA